jgi:hypothetical protein
MKIRRLAQLFVFAALLALAANVAQAQSSTFTYQGRLTDGAAPANGSYDLQFKLWDALTTGNQLPIGTPVTQTLSGVSVVNGIFTVQLDFTTAAFAGGARYLEVSVKHPADSSYTTLAPRQQLNSAPYAIRSLNAVAADTATNATQLGALAANQYALKTDTAPDSDKLGGVSANNYLLKSGGTMTGALNLPANGLNVGTTQIAMSDSGVSTGNVMIGSGSAPGSFSAPAGFASSTAEKFVVNGNITVPATSNYAYRTPKTYKARYGPADFVSARADLYGARIDEGFSSATVNGLNSMWASGGTAGTVAYFLAPVRLPDAASITGLAAQLVKNGGSLQSVVELYRSDMTGYLSNTAQLIATTTTTNSGGGIAFVNASSVNTSFNVVDNNNYVYFIRWSGEQNTQNVRLSAVTITYQVVRAD